MLKTIQIEVFWLNTPCDQTVLCRQRLVIWMNSRNSYSHPRSQVFQHQKHKITLKIKQAISTRPKYIIKINNWADSEPTAVNLRKVIIWIESNLRHWLKILWIIYRKKGGPRARNHKASLKRISIWARYYKISNYSKKQITFDCLKINLNFWFR